MHASSPTSPLPPAARWRDSKRWWWLLSPAFPALVWLNLVKYQLTGVEAWLWVSSLVMYGLIPLLDTWLGEDHANPPE
ncbi:MAG: alkane 1-monooxygenase, partial [Methylibium sp.]|nr:alkane 1-monooxygenase [Methylibium sp.]